MGRRPRRLLLRLETRRVGRACYCKHDRKHKIIKGELRLVVQDEGPAARENGYCVTCGMDMLLAAQATLTDLIRQLELEWDQARGG